MDLYDVIYSVIPIIVQAIINAIWVWKRPEPNYNRTLGNLIVAIAGSLTGFLLAYFVIRAYFGNQLSISLSMLLAALPSIVILLALYAFLQTEEDIKLRETLEHKFVAPYNPKNWARPTNKQWMIISLTVIVVLLIFISFIVYVSNKPRLFSVYIQLKSSASNNPGETGAFFQTTIENSAKALKEKYDVKISFDPRDFVNSDLRITLQMTDGQCNSESTENIAWGWDATNQELQSYLLQFLEETGVEGASSGKELCIKNENTEALIDFIMFANGLNNLLLDQPLMDNAIESFRVAAESKENEETDSERDETDAARFVRFPRRVRTCAQLMSMVADGSLDENERKPMKELVGDDPSTLGEEGADQLSPDSQAESLPEPGYCLAQAYYWLGRDALWRHESRVRTQLLRTNSILPEPVMAQLSMTIPATPEPSEESDQNSLELLSEAYCYFSKAIDIHARSLSQDQTSAIVNVSNANVECNFDETTGSGRETLESLVDDYQWIYYLYRGLTRYRQGSLRLAQDELVKSVDSYVNHPADEWPTKAIISYLQARIKLETAAYQEKFTLNCPDIADQLDAEARTHDISLADLRLLSNEIEQGLTGLSIGTMSQFNEALYWASVQTSETLNNNNLCDTEAASENPRCLAIEGAAHARQQVASVQGNEAIELASAPIDVLLAKLYELDGQQNEADLMLRNGVLDRFLVNAGAPAYAIPLRPRLEPDLICGLGVENYQAPDVQVNRGSLSFLWLLRTNGDELVFDYQNPIDADAESADAQSNCADNDTFCVRVGDGRGNSHDWRLKDMGFGLFESEPITVTYASLTAIPERGLDNNIHLRGDLEVSLIYTVDSLNSVELNVGSLPITTLGELSAEVEINPDENATDCLTCYVIDVNALLEGENVEISSLSLSEPGEPPNLIFKAALYEKVVIPDAPATDPADKVQVRLVSDVDVVELHSKDGRGRFSGRFSSVVLDPDKHYHVRVFVEDRNGREKALYRVDIQLPA